MTNEKVLNGVNKLVDIVKLTLGTKGRTVLFKDDRNKPHITKDGVTVAHNIFAEDNFENMVITVLREASMKTMQSSGDGTTSTMILAQYLINKGIELMSEGISYYELSKQMDDAKKDVIKYITDKSITVESNGDLLKDIASISSNDDSIGELIYDIINEITLYGHMQVKKSLYTDIRVDLTSGMRLNKGWYETFMTNNKKELTFEAEECNVLVVDDNITNFGQVEPYIKATNGEPLVVFCNDIGDIFLKQLGSFITNNGYPLCFVQNDGFGDRKALIMQDLATYVGGRVVGKESVFDPESIGRAENVIVSELSTTLTGGYFDEDELDSLIASIVDAMDKDEEEDNLWLSNIDKKFHKRRLAGLKGGVAVIHAGGRTEMEMKELKDRLDDAVLAVEASIKEGVSVGGGYTYVNCQNHLSTKNMEPGYKLVLDSLDQPFKQLLINADLFPRYRDYKSKIQKGKALDLRNNKLCNAKNGEYKVYDPTLVLIDSVSNAITVAKSLLSVKEMLYDNDTTQG